MYQQCHSFLSPFLSREEFHPGGWSEEGHGVRVSHSQSGNGARRPAEFYFFFLAIAFAESHNEPTHFWKLYACFIMFGINRYQANQWVVKRIDLDILPISRFTLAR
jgi:hypothetical protein